MTRFLQSVICMAGAMMLLVGQAQGATWTVKADGTANKTKVTDAISSATTGDTILIQDSAVYAGNLDLTSKSLTIIAAPGCNPTIQATTSNNVVKWRYNGGRLGSLNGGRITIDGNNLATYGFCPWSAVPAGEEIICENLLINGAGKTAVWYQGAPVSVTLRKCDIVGAAPTVGTTSIFNLVAAAASATTFTLDRCSINVPGNVRVFFNSGGNQNLVINKSIIKNSGRPLQYNFSTGIPTKVTDSVLAQNNMKDMAIYLSGNGNEGTIINMSRSMLLGYALVEGSKAGIIADHCDFISSQTTTTAAAITTGNVTETSRTMILSNSNLVDLNRGRGINLTFKTGDVATLTNCNITSVPLQAGGTATEVNSLNLNPGYTSLAADDSRYSNATVKTGDSSGGPIGSNQNFVPLRTTWTVKADGTADQTKVTDAISSATTGDTILILDSEIYAGNLDLTSKSLTIIAAPGANPTIRATTSNNVVKWRYNGGRLGSLDGGRITIEGNNLATYGFCPWSAVPAGEEIICENLLINGAGKTAVWYQGAPVNVTLRQCDIAGAAPLTGTTSIFNLIAAGASATTFTLDRCTINVPGNVRVFFNSGGNQNLVINKSIIKNSGRPLQYNFSAGIPTKVTDSVLAQNNMKDMAIYLSGNGNEGTIINMNRSMVLGSATVEGSKAGIVADHCDFISSQTTTTSAAVTMANVVETSRTMILSNSNLVDLNRGRGISLTFKAGDVAVLTNCNITSIPLQTAGTATEANSLNLNPGYTSLAADDSSYSNATVLTGDSVGGPIGSNQNFVPLVPVELSTFQVI